MLYSVDYVVARSDGLYDQHLHAVTVAASEDEAKELIATHPAYKGLKVTFKNVTFHDCATLVWTRSGHREL